MAVEEPAFKTVLEDGDNVSPAQYNPPWTPWFMRRNEVMVAVEPAP